MLCVKCKKEIDDDSDFCKFCGKAQVKTLTRSKKKRGNGQGSVYRLPNGTYRAVVTLGYLDGKRITKTKTGFKTKKEAVDFLPLLKNNYEEKKQITFSELFSVWKQTHYQTIGKSKQSSYNTAYRRCEPLYFRDASTIKLVDMQEVVDRCPGGYYRSRI